MKIYEDKKIPAIPETIKSTLVRTDCDICNQELLGDNEVDIVNRKTDYHYPECGAGEEINIDMCSKCFDEKLIPWLKSQGCNQEYKKWSFDF